MMDRLKVDLEVELANAYTIGLADPLELKVRVANIGDFALPTSVLVEITPPCSFANKLASRPIFFKPASEALRQPVDPQSSAILSFELAPVVGAGAADLPEWIQVQLTMYGRTLTTARFFLRTGAHSVAVSFRLIWFRVLRE